MSLASGTLLAHYRLTERIGAGGMGEVWKATDTALGREVAIKILPEAFAADPERLARFEREAKLLASLNHPNIATIHGLHEAAGVRFLAMELVPGDDLSERLSHGKIPVAEAIDIARQTAEALEAAHEQGVVHRDLKPANVKITPDGRVKVLDFGLAKASESAVAARDAGQSPTITSLGTVAGVIIGTAAYMSPEQARGKPVDKRADVWAFGCLLFEMLAGKRPFDGDTISDTLAAVLAKDVDWSALPAATPARVRDLLTRCLDKDPKRRLRDIGEARIELENVLVHKTVSGSLPGPHVPAGTASAPAPAKRSPAAAVMGIVALAALAIAAWSLVRPAPQPAPARLTRLQIARPADESYTGPGTFAIAPDASAVVFVVTGGTDQTRLRLRELDDPVGRDLPGTEGVTFPFWSPDSRDIAFFADGKLRRVPRAGGAARTVCTAPNGRGGAWGSSGMIVFAPDPYSALMKVAADGGVPAPATKLDAARKQDSHRFPAFLPDGRHFVYTVQPDVQQGLYQNDVASLDDPAGKPLLLAAGAARYAAPGYMIFARDQALVGQKIDLKTLTMTGDIVPLADHAEVFPRVSGQAPVDVAADGTLVYDSPDRRATDAIWYARDGRVLGKAFTHPTPAYGGAVSPRGDHLAFVAVDESDLSVFVTDIATGVETRVIPSGRKPRGLAWSPRDGRLVLVMRDPSGGTLFTIDPNGGAERKIADVSARFMLPSSVGPDGTIVLDDLIPARRYDIVYLPGGAGSEFKPYMDSAANEASGVVSPDGRSIAYQSDTSGRNELYVDSFPEHREARRVSSAGVSSTGTWRDDGREIYFGSADNRSVMACEVTTSPSLAIGPARTLFSLPEDVASVLPMPHGDRFLVLIPVGKRPTALNLVSNWSAQLEKGR